jgi:hypothetical protein
MQDLGRDLICTKGDLVEVVQCKYWSHHKEIREAFICQLIGTYIKYIIDNKRNMKNTKAVMITSTVLSDVARKFARTLEIEFIENKQIESYPLIKCNISKRTRERIYHLPFDQQYDNVRIEEEQNECYVATAAEAEKLGYRRAFRWRGGNAAEASLNGKP